MKISYFTRPAFFATLLLLAIIALTGAACSTAPVTEANANTARTNANAPAASPMMMANSNTGAMPGMSGMDHSTMRSSPAKQLISKRKTSSR